MRWIERMRGLRLMKFEEMSHPPGRAEPVRGGGNIGRFGADLPALA